MKLDSIRLLSCCFFRQDELPEALLLGEGMVRALGLLMGTCCGAGLFSSFLLDVMDHAGEMQLQLILRNGKITTQTWGICQW